MGGMTAAAMLAQVGQRVLVLEQLKLPWYLVDYQDPLLHLHILILLWLAHKQRLMMVRVGLSVMIC